MINNEFLLVSLCSFVYFEHRKLKEKNSYHQIFFKKNDVISKKNIKNVQ